MAISPEHQTLVCVLRHKEDERSPGSLLQVRVTDLIEFVPPFWLFMSYIVPL